MVPLSDDCLRFLVVTVLVLNAWHAGTNVKGLVYSMMFVELRICCPGFGIRVTPRTIKPPSPQYFRCVKKTNGRKKFKQAGRMRYFGYPPCLHSHIFRNLTCWAKVTAATSFLPPQFTLNWERLIYGFFWRIVYWQNNIHAEVIKHSHVWWKENKRSKNMIRGRTIGQFKRNLNKLHRKNT